MKCGLFRVNVVVCTYRGIDSTKDVTSVKGNACVLVRVCYKVIISAGLSGVGDKGTALKYDNRAVTDLCLGKLLHHNGDNRNRLVYEEECIVNVDLYRAPNGDKSRKLCALCGGRAVVLTAVYGKGEVALGLVVVEDRTVGIYVLKSEADVGSCTEHEEHRIGLILKDACIVGSCSHDSTVSYGNVCTGAKNEQGVLLILLNGDAFARKVDSKGL